MHPQHEVAAALRLVAQGLNDSQISRATGINRRTVNTWRAGRIPRLRPQRGRRSACPRCDGSPLDEPPYAYLLGLYLGDGHIVQNARTFSLRISQDARYFHLVTLAIKAIERVRSVQGKVGVVERPGVLVVQGYWQHWPCLFPQHGPGRKHHRPIVLEDWQVRLVGRYPRQLIRGLIHSDGCRALNRVRDGRYEYPRYFFTNSSEDILRIFKDACDAAEVAYRMSKPNTVSIARRPSVAKLDSFVGPKA